MLTSQLKLLIYLFFQFKIFYVIYGRGNFKHYYKNLFKTKKIFRYYNKEFHMIILTETNKQMFENYKNNQIIKISNPYKI